jgi:hypothetical protein
MSFVNFVVLVITSCTDTHILHAQAHPAYSGSSSRFGSGNQNDAVKPTR